MRIVHRSVFVLLVCAALLAGGCMTTPYESPLFKAYRARVDNEPTYNDSARFLQACCAQHDKDYVVWAMEYTSLCMLGGNYDAAREEMAKCLADIRSRQDKTGEFIAVVSAENAKLFKGEPFERAMACTYMGMILYMEGNYNDARIYCSQADLQDATTRENMAKFRHDFGAAYYWLGRSLLKLNQADNARIAFQTAGGHIARDNEPAEVSRMQSGQASIRQKRIRLEQESFKLATTGKTPVPGAVDMSASPTIDQMPETLGQPAADNPVIASTQKHDEFFSVAYQQEVNLIVVIEGGMGPMKFVSDYGTQIVRAPYEDCRYLVYLDGHKAGPAFQVLDLFHQADTRGFGEKEAAQAAKGITKAILKQMPYGIGTLASFWDVQADERYWHLLPGEVHVFAAKVKPGLYSVNIQSFDSNGCLLPRYSQTRYGIPVHEGQDNVYLISNRPEADNAYGSPTASPTRRSRQRASLLSSTGGG